MKTTDACLIATALLLAPAALLAQGSMRASATVLPSAKELASQAQVVGIAADGRRSPLALTSAQKATLLLGKGEESLRIGEKLTEQGIQVVEVTY